MQERKPAAGRQGSHQQPRVVPRLFAFPGAERTLCTMIEVVDLVKSFRDLRRGLVHAVDHVSFEARTGEIFVLLGPNGAGKTTTMRILCTVLRPTGGTARIVGYDVTTQASQVRQNIG